MKSRAFPAVIGVLAISLLLPAGFTHASPAYGAAKWDWPLKPARLSAGFDRPPQNWLPGHRGVDLVGRSGDQVLAAGNGVVSFAGSVAGKGVVVIKHGVIRTTYEPVTASVAIGSRVRVGEVIGTLAVGEGHCSSQTTVSCLHWGLIRGEKYLNPLLLVQKSVRLLPKPSGGPVQILRAGGP
jgi:murein DD-endopeptidase MepM/ murein hydrolase activator NlpD